MKSIYRESSPPLPITDSGVNKPQLYSDLLTFAIDHHHHQEQYDEQKPLFIDAVDPSRSLNKKQFRVLVRTLVAGFKACGVKRGDCVVVHLGNCVSILLSLFIYYIMLDFV